MIDRLLTKFNRNAISHEGDLGERIGNIGLGLLRVGLGKTVSVQKIPTDGDRSVFTPKIHSISSRVAAVALFILLLPLTAVLAAIGCVATVLSKSHKQMFDSYIQSDISKNNPQKAAQTEQKQARPKQKGVQFKTARIRFFDKKKPAKEVANLRSIQLNNEFKLEPIHIDDPAALQTRKIPRVGSYDTVIFPCEGFKSLVENANSLSDTEREEIFFQSVKSVHGEGELFDDSEIIEKLPLIEKVEIGSNVYAFYTKNRKAIIQQQATRGCTAAVAAMLIMDHGKKPDLSELRRRNLGTNNDQIRDIEKAGLKAAVNSAKNLQELRNLILQNDSCIVFIDGSIGGHVVVVDEVTEDLSQVRLREPYHGWEITIGSQTFLRDWIVGGVMQVVKN